MNMVFVACAFCCIKLAVTKMDISTPGVGITAKADGIVVSITSYYIQIDGRKYKLKFKPMRRAAELDAETNGLSLPRLQNW